MSEGVRSLSPTVPVLLLTFEPVVTEVPESQSSPPGLKSGIVGHRRRGSGILKRSTSRGYRGSLGWTDSACHRSRRKLRPAFTPRGLESLWGCDSRDGFSALAAT